MRSENCATVLGHGGGGDRDGEFVTGQARHDSGTGGLGLQPFGHSMQHAIAAGVPEHVVDLLESVEANNQQRHFTGLLLRVEDHHRQAIVKRAAVGEPGQQIVFRQMPDTFGFAFPNRDVAQDNTVLKAVGALPAGETCLDRKHLSVLPQPVELHHQPTGLLRSDIGLFAVRNQAGHCPRARGANESNGCPIISTGS